MTLYFIIPVAIVLLATYIFKNSADEIAYLSAAIAVVALLVALIVAPWQLKLVLLSIVALTSTKLWFPSRQPKTASSSNLLAENSPLESLATKSEQETENPPTNLFNPWIKGSYRGVNYEHNISPFVKLSQVELKGKYRGQTWKSSQVENQAAVQPKYEIKYRGAKINPQKSAPVQGEQTQQDQINLISILPE